jgi:hypothetical protein
MAAKRQQRQHDIKQLAATGLPKVKFFAKIGKGLAARLCQSRASKSLAS